MSPNRLADESSPYLRQHAENPVDWYPWGDAARARAQAEDRPILLSVGYAACHWCHVMAHESFENAATAAVMNELFVNVKVDREERPDVDAIYMQAVQAMTGRGGWPMTVFLTPEGEPFYAGTYYPPEDRHGMPSFTRVLRSVSEAYRTQRDRVDRTAATVREMYERQAAPSQSTGQVSTATLARAAGRIAADFDAEHGGFGGAPKFPHTMALEFLLAQWRRTGDGTGLDIALRSFRAMARGGVYDQVGGAFHRYSVDARWLVPHFEKMLYDNALLTRLGVHLWQATGDLEVRRITEECIDWVAREMTDEDGGFYATLDADSEGEEGRFYVWSADEFDTLLGDDAAAVGAYWGVTAAGNFEGDNILHVAEDPAPASARAGIDEGALAAALVRARARLYDARAARTWPGRDEKIITSWNGLMIRSIAEAARAFGRDDYAAMATRAGAFLRDHLVRADGRVWRIHANGQAKIGGMLEDHAAAALAFVSLYELTFDRAWLDLARRVTDALLAAFWDDEAGQLYDTAADAESLVTRPREVADNATPSGTSLAVELMVHLGDLLQDADLRRRGAWVLETLAEPMARYGSAFGHLLGVADVAVRGAVEVALVGEPHDDAFRALAAAVGRHYLPGLVLAGGPPDAGGSTVPLLADRPLQDGRATAYVCRGYTCEAPVTDVEALEAQLAAAPRADATRP